MSQCRETPTPSGKVKLALVVDPEESPDHPSQGGEHTGAILKIFVKKINTH
jgi:hypothetical protein